MAWLSMIISQLMGQPGLPPISVSDANGGTSQGGLGSELSNPFTSLTAAAAVCQISGAAVTTDAAVSLAATGRGCFGAYTLAAHRFGGKPVYIQVTDSLGAQIKSDERWMIYYDSRLNEWAAGHVPNSPPSSLCMLSETIIDKHSEIEDVKKWKMLAAGTANKNVHVCVNCAATLKLLDGSRPCSVGQKSLTNSVASIGGMAAPAPTNNPAAVYHEVKSLMTPPAPPTMAPTAAKANALTTLNLLRNIIQAGKTTNGGNSKLSSKLLQDVKKLLIDTQHERHKQKKHTNKEVVPKTPTPSERKAATTLTSAASEALMSALMLENHARGGLYHKSTMTVKHVVEFSVGSAVKVVSGPFTGKTGVVVGVTHILTEAGVSAAYGVKLNSLNAVIHFNSEDLVGAKLRTSSPSSHLRLVSAQQQNVCMQKLVSQRNVNPCTKMTESAREYCVVHLCAAFQQKSQQAEMARRGMFRMRGFLSQSNAMGKLLLHSNEQAEAFCMSRPECAGFSYKPAKGNSLHQVWFKTSSAGFVPNMDWVTYLKVGSSA